MNTELLLEVWKKSRDSIEHFDKILSDFRKVIFTFDAAFLAATVSIALSQIQNKIIYIAYLGLVLNIMNLLIWLIEKHYHLYLIVSARVAKRVEENIQLDSEIRLTDCLGKAKKYEQFGIQIKGVRTSFYDLIYILPAFLALCISLFSHSAVLVILVLILFVIEALFIIYVLNKQNISERSQ